MNKIAILFVLLLIPLAFAQDLVLTDMNAEQISGLSTDQKNAITAEKLITCFQSIECASNLGDLSGYPNAVVALQQRYGVTVAFGSSARLVGGVLTSSLGSFDFNKEKGWEIKVTSDGEIEVVKLQEISEGSISSLDKFTLTKQTTFTTSLGVKTKVKGLSFENGKSFVKKGDIAEIDMDRDGIIDMKIPGEKNNVDVYFDDKPREGNYVSLTEHRVKIGSKKGGDVKVIPQPGNKLFQMIKREYAIPDNIDWEQVEYPSDAPKEFKRWVFDDLSKFSIIVSNGDSLTATSREDQGKTILLQHKSGGGDFEVKTGRGMEVFSRGKRVAYDIDGNPVELEPSIGVKHPDMPSSEGDEFDASRSVAFKLVSDLDQESELFVTSSNRFGFLRDGEYYFGNVINQKVTDDLAFNQILNRHDLKFLYPVFTYLGDASSNMAQTIAQLIEKYPDLSKSLSSFTFNNRFDTTGFNPSTKTLQIGEKIVDPGMSFRYSIRGKNDVFFVIDHELVHAAYTAAKIKNSLSLRKVAERRGIQHLIENLEDIQSEIDIMEENPSDWEQLLSYAKDDRRTLRETIAKEIGGYPGEIDDKFKEGLTRAFKRVVSSQDFRTETESIYKDTIEWDSLDVDNPENLHDWVRVLDIRQGTDKLARVGLFDRGTGRELDHKEDSPSLKRLRRLIKDEGGLDIYAYKKYKGNKGHVSDLEGTIKEFHEAPTMTWEADVAQLKQAPDLNQMIYEVIEMSDFPEILKEKQREKYWKIVGGPDSEYCKANGCGRCIQFPVVCEVEK